MQKISDQDIINFVQTVHERGLELYRAFAWREIDDPYAVLLSEIMLQQTQTARVERYFEDWMQRFPSIDALSAASTTDILSAWQGLGYNRRGLMLKKLADEVAETRAGALPETYEEMLKLPGVGPATAAGVMAFAHNMPSAYLETNVRTVVLHELMPEHDEVSDKIVTEIVKRASVCAGELGIDARAWNYALLDYGVWLKKNYPNPSRRSKHHTKQSKFEGSHRQKRAALLREILSQPGMNVSELEARLPWSLDEFEEALNDLLKEGFVEENDERFSVAN